ncbi:serine hydrolase domain-containing protein [Actinoplanes couchii]|uniref:Beta-lactamase-related domain-containing protein n=1 Tax=Actinoplanes couchii TaxID=403638 RepID=A0ABQ3XJ03_9ACTN|nr:serine hydrolase domain-containing protein [Actinoplanes couchii]MDR6323998.1 CubicO group peptidase (beta-lactamase class C family) [Actinoplanes couchii]GID58468.1 hypothetical protein Aco03nite_068720 [Actinoplanes couchii]
MPQLDSAHWQHRLSTLAAEFGVVGASLGILHGSSSGGPHDMHVIDAATGVTNVRSGDPVRTGTVFQIGSITKVYTTTAALRLVADGRLDLDKPLPMGGTLRHLLTHTSGIPGDLFTDTGRGDDCLERFADGLADVPPLLPAGAAFSYCNAGFSLLGRIIEQVTGKMWDEAMRDLVFTPLGLRHTVTLPEEALLHSAAMGHERQPDGTLQPAARWGLPRSTGPAGNIAATARDVLAFARFHLNDGDGLIPADLIREMRTTRVEVPFHDGETEGLGLAWFHKSPGAIGHDGDTIGQTAFLRLLPTHRLAVVLLTNGGPARDLYRALYQEILTEVADLTLPAPLQPPDEPPRFELARHAGVYIGHDYQNELANRNGTPVLSWSATGALREVMPSAGGEYEVAAATENVLLYREPGTKRWHPATFHQLPDGRDALHIGLRAYLRAPGTP